MDFLAENNQQLYNFLINESDIGRCFISVAAV